MLSKIKDIYRHSKLYEWRSKRWARQQEQEYIDLSRDAYGASPTCLDMDEDFLGHSRRLLRRSWEPPSEPKEDVSELHLFVVDHPNRYGVWFEEELEESLDLSLFSLTRHRRLYSQGRRDWEQCVGVDSDERETVIPSVGDEEEWRQAAQADIKKAARAADERRAIDLCFVNASVDHVSPDTLQAIRRLGAPVAVWFLDEKHGFRRAQEPLIGSYDLHLTNSYHTMRWYISRGTPAYYFPQAADPGVFEPREMERDIDVSFVGAAYGARLRFIKKLQRQGIDVECFGKDWPNGEVEDLVGVINRSEINLGLGYTGHSSRLTCVKGRDLEVPACAGFYLTTFDSELVLLFDVGSEIACFRSAYDCADLIRHHLSCPAMTARYRRKARSRVVNDHTWTQRFEDLGRWLGLLRGGSAQDRRPAYLRG